MKHFKVWQAPFWALFSTPFYRDLGSSGKGVGFVYLLCVLSVSCAIESIQTGIHYYRKVESGGPHYAEQIPTMEIKDGKLKMDKESIYFVFDPETQQPVIAFNTNSETEKKTPQELGVAVLVTEKNVIANMSNGSDNESGSEILNFAFIKDLKMDKQSFMQMLRISTIAVPLIDFALRIVPAWLGHICQALAYSVAGLVLAHMISVKIKYEGILRVASFALGNAIVLGIFAKFFPAEIAGVSLTNFGFHLGFLQLLVAFIYTLFGVSANLSTQSFTPIEPHTSAGE